LDFPAAHLTSCDTPFDGTFISGLPDLPREDDRSISELAAAR
jgi:hypothetical protein